MGYTNHTIDLLKPFLKDVKTVCDLGAQNHHDLPNIPFISDWYKKRNFEYMCIDLNGENDAKTWDLSEPVKTNRTFDLVCDMGTSEHVKDLFTCFQNVNKLTKVGGLMYHENPKTGNWPQHGYHYRDTDFYRKLSESAGYELIHIDEWPACWNVTDGWIIRAIMRKISAGFIERENFPVAYES